MKPSDSLFRLIKSLEKSEKGYFKKFAQGYGKNQNYMLLFDAIDAQEVYDEAAILKKFRSQPFSKQLSVAKNYLWELILKSQRQYRADTSKFMIMNALMENGEILYEKGLYEDAMKLWDKASAMATEFDERPFILDIETARRRYFIDMTAGNWKEFVTPSYDESFRHIREYETMLRIQQKYVTIINYIKTQPFFRTEEQKQEWEEFMNDPILLPENEPEGFYGKLYFNYIYNIYYLLCRNKEKALPYIKKIVGLWDEHVDLKNFEPIKYISAVNNYVINLAYLGEFAEYFNYFEKMVPPKLNSISQEAIYFEHWWLLKHNYFRLKRDIDGVTKFIAETKPDIEKYAPYINKVRLMLIRFSISLYHTTMSDYPAALDYLELVMGSKEIELRKDVQSMARIMNIVNHYEAGHLLLMEHLTRSSKRFLQANDYYYETERIFMKYMNNAIKAADQHEAKVVFTNMYNELETLFNSNEQEKMAFETIRILDWATAKMKGISHLEVVKNSPPVV